MTNFVYTSGDPSHLVGGTSASMADMQGPLTDLRTFLNGSITDTNLASNAAITETKLATGSSGLAKGSFSAYRNAALSLATAAVVTFETEDWDTSGWYDAVTNARFTPQTPGFYRLSWRVASGGGLAADNFWGSDIFKNGALHKSGQYMNQRSGIGAISTGTVLVVANGTTDFFDVRVAHNKGSAEGLSVGAANTYFHGELVGRS